MLKERRECVEAEWKTIGGVKKFSAFQQQGQEKSEKMDGVNPNQTKQQETSIGLQIPIFEIRRMDISDDKST
jgi:hypothetical protein